MRLPAIPSFILLMFFSLVCVIPTAYAVDKTGAGNAPVDKTGAGNLETTFLLNPLGPSNCNPADNCLMNLLKSILGFVIQIGAIFVIVAMVYVGFLFVTAQGNESKLTEAKSAFFWTVIGALVLLGAQAIFTGIKATIDALSV